MNVQCSAIIRAPWFVYLDDTPLIYLCVCMMPCLNWCNRHTGTLVVVGGSIGRSCIDKWYILNTLNILNALN